MKKTAILAAVLAVAAAAHAQKTITLGGDDNYSQQAMTVGDKVVIKLLAARADGYMWKVGTADPAVLQLDAVQPKVPYSKQAFAFTAAGPGVTTLVLNNMKKGATEPAQIYQIMLAVSSLPGQAKPEYVVGKFMGARPCADCSGQEVSVTFLAHAQNQYVDTLFKRTTKYLDSPGGKDKQVEDAGTWVILPGTAADPTAEVYALTPDGKATQEFYWLKSKEELVPLDADKKPLTGPIDMTLQLQK